MRTPSPNQFAGKFFFHAYTVNLLLFSYRVLPQSTWGLSSPKQLHAVFSAQDQVKSPTGNIWGQHFKSNYRVIFPIIMSWGGGGNTLI